MGQGPHMVLGSGCEVGLGRALVCRRRHVSTQCLRRRCRGGAAPRQRVRRVQPTACWCSRKCK